MSIADAPRSSVFEYVSSRTPISTKPVHPLGCNAKVLLCSVFGPYARDDEYGSRLINPMELWHNQVTRTQGAFSMRMFHRSWGLMLIQANIQARCTLLDFPTLDRFVQELRDNQYDIVGVSGILPNLPKVAKMCQLIRLHLPKAQIVVGGHITGQPDLAQRIDADHIVRGDGVRWFRQYLGQDANDPINHPAVLSGINQRTMGLAFTQAAQNNSAALIPSVGCPIGCNFCSTSAMFGGKGKFVSFYPEAKDLFAVMCQLEEKMKVHAFFVMDENFLLQRTRAMELLELMRKHNKSWALYVFSSANALAKYTMDELVSLGVSWLWLGLEGKDSQYGKLGGTDTRKLVAELQENGIRVLGSSIVGMEEHTPENIDEAIDYAVSHDTDFHQFMLYTPVAGTPLYAEHNRQGTLLRPDEIAFEDTHGQFRFNFRHKHIKDGQETGYLLKAFNEDFRVNGPSVLRVIRTTLKGYQKHRHHPEARVREHYRLEMDGAYTAFPAAVWAARKWFADNKPLRKRLDELAKEIGREFGWRARLAASVLGRYAFRKLSQESKRLAAGQTYEPPTYYERNYVGPDAGTPATLIQSVSALAKTTVHAE